MLNYDSKRPIDFIVSVGLILILAALCYRILSPFWGLLVWSMILATVLYPLHQRISRALGGRHGWAASLMVLATFGLVGVPVALLSSSLADSIVWLIENVRSNSLHIPMPPEQLKTLPLIGEKLFDAWALASSDLPALIHQMQPKIGELTRSALSYVADLGSGILMFFVSFIVAAIMMVFGSSASSLGRSLAERVAGTERGARFLNLATTTVRAVALGVIGVAALQALMIGTTALVFGIPGAGVLSIVALVLAIIQLPVSLVTLPLVAWVWLGGDFGHINAIAITILLLLAGLIDNVLKPVFLSRGVDAPMPVILLGALGGMITSGVQGMFVGAAVLAIGYQVLMGWLHEGLPVPANQQSDQQP